MSTDNLQEGEFAAKFPNLKVVQSEGARLFWDECNAEAAQYPIDTSAEISMEDPIAAIALNRFHILHLAPLQRFAIANILEDARTAEDEYKTSALFSTPSGTGFGLSPSYPMRRETMRQLVLFPTGFGKSVCFQLPALLLDGLTVIVYPLLALMNDQKRRLEEASLPCALFRGGLSDEEWAREEESVNSGKAKIIIANPEILANSKLARLLARHRIAHLVIDEAHCIAEWGETFRPAYLSLGEIAQNLAPTVLSAFTATAGPDIIASIESRLFLGNAYRLVSSEADRTNVLYGAMHTLSPTRTLRMLALSCKKPAIIFERSRPGVKMKAEYLRSNGYLSVRFYHAGLSRKERENVESWFQSADDAILVTTNAYGMGMDKKNIRTVIHTSLPDSPEAYIQEAGRGGRDGEPAIAMLIHDLGRGPALQSGGEISEYTRSRRARLAPYPSLTGCRREFLLNAMGEMQTPLCGRCDNCLEAHATKRYGGGGQGARVWPDEDIDLQLLRTEGFLEALSFIAEHPRTFDNGELIEQMWSEGHRGQGGKRILPHWRSEELAELVEGLQFTHCIAAAARGPWKGKLTLTERGQEYYHTALKFMR